MDNRDTFKEIQNTSDDNEPQETENEAKIPDVTIFSDGCATTEKSSSETQGYGKLRLSFMKAFDLPYSESEQSSLEPHKIQQLIIEGSDQNLQLSPTKVSTDSSKLVSPDETVEETSKSFEKDIIEQLHGIVDKINKTQESEEKSLERVILEFESDKDEFFEEKSKSKVVEILECSTEENLEEFYVAQEETNASKELFTEEKFESELSEKTEVKLIDNALEKSYSATDPIPQPFTQVEITEVNTPVEESPKFTEKDTFKEKAEEEPVDAFSKELLESSVKEIPDQKSEEEVNETFEIPSPVDELTTEADTTDLNHQDEEQHLDSGVESIEDSYAKSAKSPVDDLEEQENKNESSLTDDEILTKEHKPELDGQITSDDDSKTISEGSVHEEQSKLLTDSAPTKSPFGVEANKYQMADLNEKLNEQLREISELKLQLNATQQSKTALELIIMQKEEVIIKNQADSLKSEQAYKQEIKQLQEELKENSKLIPKELEEQLKEATAREAKALAELSQRIKDDLNYQKIMEEYENAFAGHFTDYQKLKVEHETALRHLANIELAFSDVHQKYEKSKELLEASKANVEILTDSLQEAKKTCKQHEERYESLKAHAKGQIEKSNKEIISMRDNYETESSKLRAIIKRLEIKCSSLEVTLQQKTEECGALSALCEEVTGKKV